MLRSFAKVALDDNVDWSRYCRTRKFYCNLSWLETNLLLFKIHISFILDRNLHTVLFFVLGQFTIKSNYLPCGYSVGQRIYKLDVFMYHISFVVENFITLHSMNIVLGYIIKNTWHVIGIAIYNWTILNLQLSPIPPESYSNVPLGSRSPSNRTAYWEEGNNRVK